MDQRAEPKLATADWRPPGRRLRQLARKLSVGAGVRLVARQPEKEPQARVGDGGGEHGTHLLRLGPPLARARR